ncbi:hypothetical protein F5B20DRAFT_530008 [Whalleya microplaca]|nr:hypothetical protein F5B20DRAFT_530008 [Whalleya microplaca]
MHCFTMIAALAATTLATPVSSESHTLNTRIEDAAPAGCDFTNFDSFDQIQGNNWCMRGYYAADNIGCNDDLEATGRAPFYYTEPTYPYCTCHSTDADAHGNHPVAVGIWFKGLHNPQSINIGTSDQQTDDGQCYSDRLKYGTLQSNTTNPQWSKSGVQFTCLWLNHTNVPEQIVGFSTAKYVGNPKCPYS